MKNIPTPGRYMRPATLAKHSDVGERFIRDALKDPDHPLPHFRLNAKTILIDCIEYDEWLRKHFRSDPGSRLDCLVDECLRGVI